MVLSQIETMYSSGTKISVSVLDLNATRRSKIVSRASAMCVEHLLRATVPKIAFVIYTC